MEVDEPAPDVAPTEMAAPDEPGNGDGEQAGPEAAHWGRRSVWAALRAVAVLLVAAAVYPEVIPVHHTDRARMAELVPTRTGIAAFDKAKPHAGEQPDTATKVQAINSAAKKDPGGTGIYSVEWSPDRTSGAGVIAFLLPSPAAAKTALGQITSQQLGPKSYSVDHLNRVSTFTDKAVPGSSGSVYHPAKVGGPPGLAITVFRSGRVVALDEIANVNASTIEANARKLTALEYRQVRALGSGFTLQVTHIPVAATIIWGVGAVLLAALVALIPLDRYRRRLARQRAYEAEMANKVLVGRKVVATKRRR